MVTDSGHDDYSGVGGREGGKKKRERNNSTVNSSGFGNWLGSMMTNQGREGKKGKKRVKDSSQQFWFG